AVKAGRLLRVRVGLRGHLERDQDRQARAAHGTAPEVLSGREAADPGRDAQARRIGGRCSPCARSERERRVRMAALGQEETFASAEPGESDTVTGEGGDAYGSAGRQGECDTRLRSTRWKYRGRLSRWRARTSAGRGRYRGPEAGV